MNKIRLTDRLRYHFDNFMSRGTIALVAALFAVTLCMILTAAAVLVIFSLRPDPSAEHLGIPEAIWQVTMRTIDTGTIAGDSLWAFRIVGFLVTMGGIFITSALIGVLASGLEGRLDELRRGRSRVIETGHTVILGWSPQVFTIIHELAYANRNRARQSRSAQDGTRQGFSSCVAILADRDKLEMEDEIRTKVPDTLGTRVVCRSGSPLDPDHLQIVNPETARAIIILSPGGQYPDMPVAKALLALRRGRESRSQPYHIVTAVQRPTNIDIMRMIGGDETQVFLVDRLAAFLIAQTCRQPGLSVVYDELFSFDYAAMYIDDIPALVGMAYGEALYHFENTTLIGLQPQDGQPLLNPAAETRFRPGDRAITISRKDDLALLSERKRPEIDATAIREGKTSPVPLDRLLILGWNRRAPMILDQLSHYMAPGSQILVSAPFPVEQMQAECGSAPYLQGLVTFETGNPMDRRNLERLSEADFSYIVTLSPTDVPDIQLADAATMIALLHLRDISTKSGQKAAMVSEIMDVRNLALTQVTSADDVIISERVMALALAQIAENKDIVPVFVDLLTPGGPEIYLKPAADYILPGSPVNFDTVIAAAQKKGETAIGYRLLAEAGQPERSFGVYLNPAKSALVTFSGEDRVIVLAEAG